MKLDPQICETAYLSKDARFDGRFFVGVKSTGIYCRPICPAPPPKPENVAFYATAAAAAAAGHRPCLRCRPERAPHLAPAAGTGLVRRALAMIEADVLEELRVDALAGALDVSARQLSRVFRKELGASPVEVISTHRLQHAKRLLDETALSVTDVAFAAGFGSLRRFNATFKSAYGRPPSAVRRHPKRSSGEQPIELELAYRPPYDWDEMLAFLAPRCVTGVEAVVEGRYRRAIRARDAVGTLEVAHDPAARALRLTIAFPETRRLVEIVERARRMFDLAVDPGPVHRHLAGDPLLAPALAGRPGRPRQRRPRQRRPRPLPRLPMTFDGFEAVVRAILGQGVSVASATARTTRVVEATGAELPSELVRDGLTRLFPRPGDLARAEAIPGVAPKTMTVLREVAAAVSAGEIDLDAGGDPDAVTARLVTLRGIGPWTASYVALRGLGDPDAFPASDLGLLRVAGCSAAELERRAEAWRPWRAYAAMSLWRRYAEPATEQIPTENDERPLAGETPVSRGARP